MILQGLASSCPSFFQSSFGQIGEIQRILKNILTTHIRLVMRAGAYLPREFFKFNQEEFPVFQSQTFYIEPGGDRQTDSHGWTVEFRKTVVSRPLTWEMNSGWRSTLTHAHTWR